MTLHSKYFSKSEEETKDIANIFTHYIKANSIVYLDGTLGAGKTFFARSLAKNFGILDICSSTYSFVTPYSGQINLIHCDLYRCNNTSEVVLEEIFEHLKDPWLLIIEWPKIQLPIICNSSYLVRISKLSFNERHFNFKNLIN